MADDAPPVATTRRASVIAAGDALCLMEDRAVQNDALRPKDRKRDPDLEAKVLEWIGIIIREQPPLGQKYEHYLQDGVVLSKLITAIVYNSVPQEDIDDKVPTPDVERIKEVIREMWYV